MRARAALLSMGTVHEAVVVADLTRTQIVQYAGASGDFNPLHTDERFATEEAGYAGVFAHGMLTMGLTGRMLTDWLGRDRLVRFGVRFVKQVWPGDTLTAQARVESLHRGDGEQWTAELAVTTINQRGEPVLTGYATARLDP